MSLTPVDIEILPLTLQKLGISDLPQSIQNRILLVDACLPQTQCGLCEHPDGCLPYAHAIVVHGERHNKCVPGGQPVTDAIAQLLGREKLPATSSKWSIDPVTHRPQEVRAIIREDDCIGCTKCIPACPVDAIVGTGKHMHTIFTDLCTGCELCLPPCPVDCIDLVPIDRQLSEEQRIAEQHHLKERYHTHLNRVAEQMADATLDKPVVSVVQAELGSVIHNKVEVSEDDAKLAIESAKLRTKIKKLEKQLAVRDNPKKRAELQTLQRQLETLADN